MIVRRLDGNPIIRPHMDTRMGDNINGPSLIRVPDWVERPLGRYYLYFGDHRGTFIRLAYANALTGPWRTHEAGTLDLDDSFMEHHLASPDVHVNVANKRIVMYYHGRDPDRRQQLSRVAVSPDGLRFTAQEPIVSRAYLRVWRGDGIWHGMSMGGQLYRSRDGLSPFEAGPRLDFGDQRHLAVALRDRDLHVFYTLRGDAPERMLHRRVRLTDDWARWRLGEQREVLRPEMAYEGAELPVVPSRPGPIRGPVNQLRDPAIYEENGHTYLLYSVAGESGIAIAQIDGL